MMSALQLWYVYFCCRNLNPSGKFETDAWIERIIVIGMASQPHQITLTATGQSLTASVFTSDSVLVGESVVNMARP